MQRVVSKTVTQTYNPAPHDPNATWVHCEGGTPAPQPSPPSMSQQLTPCHVKLGEDAVFSGTLTGNPLPKIYFTKEGKSIAPSPKYVMSFKGQNVSFTVKGVTKEDCAIYAMMAENDHGRLTSQTNLVEKRIVVVCLNTLLAQFGANQQFAFLNGPLLMCAPVAMAIFGKQQARIDVHWVGSPNVTWFKDGKPIQAGPKYEIVYKDGIHSLIIKDVGPNDGGNYICFANDPTGESQVCCVLKMVDPPEGWDMSKGPPGSGPNSGAKDKCPPFFTEVYQNFMPYDPDANQPIKLRVRFAGNPTPTITWFKDGKPLAPGQPYPITTTAFESILTIPKPGPNDNGVYTVEAVSPEGKDKHQGKVGPRAKKPAPPAAPAGQRKIPMGVGEIPVEKLNPELVNLRHVEKEVVQEQEKAVKPPEHPKFTSELQHLQLRESQKAHMECHYTPVDDPRLTIIWQLNGKEINASNRMQMKAEFGKAQLDINGLYYPEDTGTYTCVASNTIGTAQVNGSIEVSEDSGVCTGSLFSKAGQADKLAALDGQVADPSKRNVPTGQPLWAVKRHE